MTQLIFLNVLIARNIRLFVNEKTLKLAARHLQTNSSFDGFFIGSITVDPGKFSTKCKVEHHCRSFDYSQQGLSQGQLGLQPSIGCGIQGLDTLGT